jgi:hypothetical protein
LVNGGIQKDTLMISQACNHANSMLSYNNMEFSSNKDVAIWIRFLKHFPISKIFSRLTDTRQQSKTVYSNISLALWALSTMIFRQKSKNAFHSSLSAISSQNRKGISYLLKTDGQLPHPSTVDDYLRHIDVQQLNEALLEIFQWGQKSKVFYNHASVLSPDNTILLGCDGFWTHTYSKPHAMDKHGNNICPYCLPRRRHKGTPQEKLYWVHTFVTFLIIFQGGFKIPIYIYPLKASQVEGGLSEEDFKQECELKATHAVLPVLKNKFPRTSFTFCGDSLYANESTIKLLNELFFEYSIVRKDKSLKLLGKHCDELSSTELYQKAYRHMESETSKKETTTRKAQWFNNEAVGKEAVTNVLRFEETVVNKTGKVLTHYKGEWLCSRRLHKGNCFEQMRKGRRRWEHEDFHNTCKNRGFNAKHDMARKDANLCLVWKMMLFIAYSIFEIFRCLKLAQDACKKRSWAKFATDLFQQLLEASWDEIIGSPILQKRKIQFRLCFDVPY